MKIESPVCPQYHVSQLKLSQHEDRISSTEEIVDTIISDSSNTEGRLSMFVWSIGIVFMAIVSISFYGVLELNDFKDLYQENNIQSQKLMYKLTSAIDISTLNVNNVKYDVEYLTSQFNTIIPEIKAELDSLDNKIQSYETRNR